MSNTYYSSLSGMLAASYGLQNTSNNVANMQSHGFKRTDVFYSSLGDGGSDSGVGRGVRISGQSISFSKGNYAETKGKTDLAVVGNGFFVIRLKSNELVYTRDGEFEFHDGILTDRHTKGQVQGYDSSGNLVPIHEKGPKVTPGKASRDVFVNGVFCARLRDKKDSKDPTPPDPIPNNESKYEDVEFTLNKIYDSQGKDHSITLKFCNSTDQYEQDEKHWKLDKIMCDGIEIDPGLSQKLEFNGDGSSASSYANSIQFTLNEKQTITVHFGDYNDGTDHYVQLKTTELNPGADTQIEIYQNDGYGVGKQYDYQFDQDGRITYLYDNGQAVKGIYVGLARFDDMEHNLIPGQDNFFHAKINDGIHYGRANTNGFEAIVPGNLEKANVDSTTEFANIVVLQRMFQACSQIMDIDKQLLEELGSKS